MSFQRLNASGLYKKGCAASSNHNPVPISLIQYHPSLFSQEIMGLAGVLSVFVEKKKEKPWEVVDSKAVEPVPLFDEDDGACALPYSKEGLGALPYIVFCRH